MRTRDDIARELTEAGLGSLVERVLGSLVDEVWLAAIPGDAVLGACRIGGAPDLPPGVAWPRHRFTHAEVASWPEAARQELDTAVAAGVAQREPEAVSFALPFVAQLDLSALAYLQDRLPRRGHLWLFADQETLMPERIGDAPVCAAACVYASDGPRARITEPPPVPSGPLPSFALAPGSGYALPSASELGLVDDAWLRYDQLVHRLGQEPPRHACLTPAEHGVVATVPPDGWVTLLRVDSDYREMPPLNWGDATWLTFALPSDALDEGRWDEVRAFLWTG